MEPTNQYSSPGQSPPAPPPPPSPASRQNKVLSQREYREREGESFNMLRDVIRILTGEELRTRYEILRKAIDLLVSSYGIVDQSVGLARTLTAYEASTSTGEPENSALDQSGYSAQTAQIWHPNSGFHAATASYDTHFYDDQQHYSMSTMDHLGSQGSGEDSSNYHQFSRLF